VLTQSTAGQLAGHTPGDLVLEPLPNGELAWLRPDLDAAIREATGRSAEQPPEPRYWITDAGRRALDEDRRARALDALFGYPWPNAAGRMVWRDPHQKPAELCGAVWTCGEPAHHHNCSDCEAHCRLGDTAQDHERADSSDTWAVAHCRCAFCATRRVEVA
jgi:hypothetical protein